MTDLRGLSAWRVALLVFGSGVYVAVSWVSRLVLRRANYRHLDDEEKKRKYRLASTIDRSTK